MPPARRPSRTTNAARTDGGGSRSRCQRTISAYALYTRKQLGDVDLAKARQLIASAGDVDQLPLEASGWLLGALARNPNVRTYEHATPDFVARVWLGNDYAGARPGPRRCTCPRRLAAVPATAS